MDWSLCYFVILVTLEISHSSSHTRELQSPEFLFELAMWSVAYPESIWNMAYERHPGAAFAALKTAAAAMWLPQACFALLVGSFDFCEQCNICTAQIISWGTRQARKVFGQLFTLRSFLLFPVSKWGSRTALGGMFQMSVFHFDKSVVSRFKLHIFWQLCHQWCGLSILFPRVAQSICSSEDRQHREYKPHHKSVLFAQCFLCLVETVKQRSKPHSNWASSTFLLLVEIAISCGRIRSLTPSPPAECPCQDMAWTSWLGLLPQTPGELWRHKDMLLTSCLQPFPGTCRWWQPYTGLWPLQQWVMTATRTAVTNLMSVDAINIKCHEKLFAKHPDFLCSSHSKDRR